MIVIGLTGSIGMGKSTTAGMFRALGVPVCDSDAIVHRLTGRDGEAVPRIAAAFPGVVADGVIDRQALGARVFADPEALARLEAILHPMVRAAQMRFLKESARRRRRFVVLDVPLLYESGTDALCDAVVAVSAPRFLQTQRVLSRPGMDAARFAGALARQMPDAEKRRRADFVVRTGIGRRPALNQIIRILRLLERRRGAHRRARPDACRTRHGAAHA